MCIHAAPIFQISCRECVLELSIVEGTPSPRKEIEILSSGYCRSSNSILLLNRIIQFQADNSKVCCQDSKNSGTFQ